MIEKLIFTELSEEEQECIDHALKARQFAYAPYSKFKVGAAVFTDQGAFHSGYNVENSIFEVIHAEGLALAKMVKSKAKPLILAVVTDNDPPMFPCGFCRQFMTEFNPDGSMVVIATNLEKEYVKKALLKDLLPEIPTTDLQRYLNQKNEN